MKLDKGILFCMLITQHWVCMCGFGEYCCAVYLERVVLTSKKKEEISKISYFSSFSSNS